MSKHGFLSNYRGDSRLLTCSLYTGSTQKNYIHSPETPAEYLLLARKHELSHLWIMHDYSHDLTEAAAPAGNYKLHTPKGEKNISTISAEGLNVVWLKNSLWRLGEDRIQLENAFREIETKLGIPMAAHPGIMGLDYLRKVDEKNYWRYFTLPHADWDMIRAISVASIAHFPPISQAELEEQEYLVCFDRNSSQPYAAAQLKFGIGTPEPRKDIQFDHLMPGFWAADIEGIDRLWQGLPLIPTHRDWLPTPILKMAEQRGCKIHVREAYIWPDKANRAPVFTRWARNLWELRETYEAGTPERAAIKGMMNATIGLLRRKTGEGHRDYRPDWYSLILAEERSVVWLKAFAVWQQTGIKPVGCYHDSLFYVCNAKTIKTLTQALTTRLDNDGQRHSTEHSLGGYKLDYQINLTEESRSILMAHEPRGAADRIGVLKRWSKAYELAA